MGHEFELRKEIELDATPEQVWDAIATGPGVDSWFMGRNEIEPHEGGAVRMTIAGHTDESTITAWEPMKRLAHRSPVGDDGAFMAFEYLIEGRAGGSTVLRMVQSGVLGGDWETEYDALNEGWDVYLHSLAQYLAHFPGRRAAVVTIIKPQAADRDKAWTAIKAELGVTDEIAVGDRVHLTIDGAPPVEGVVDYDGLPTFIGVRSADGLYRFIHSGPLRGDVVVLGHHIYSDVDPEPAQQAWQSWLDRVFA
ncbi:SRPBCC domain-containing protein [Planotetraspora phitsanulokensis]|uniref:Activator of Hsp90 ATPase homologue 1/2-like C-terminal domain-containing protein n=1 Tax=Planotetraspora phitsanulokensis TaxID=575192 RepID=A0A8J3XHG1_9ACTN|nr:SRPBCC domain-containing protein [Planotetraspora phitsanulokensis]GII41947.1 hypothetical protein Pph01_69500 [Planotetraspora phitsanulokensis]